MGQWKDCSRRVSRRAALGLLGACSLLALASTIGCTSRPPQSPDERLREQAAESARQVHHDLNDAGKEARTAMHQAGRETRDIVAGARQGWGEGGHGAGSSSSPLDVNHASIAELERLPGVRASAARRIVAERPFDSAKDVETRGIVTHAEYARIAPEIVAK